MLEQVAQPLSNQPTILRFLVGRDTFTQCPLRVKFHCTFPFPVFIILRVFQDSGVNKFVQSVHFICSLAELQILGSNTKTVNQNVCRRINFFRFQHGLFGKVGLFAQKNHPRKYRNKFRVLTDFCWYLMILDC